MTISSSRRSWLVSLLCSVLLLLQVSGAHLHLCFDGQEAPASVHLLDAVPDQVPGVSSSQHHDEDVDVESTSLIKNSTAGPGSPPIQYAAKVLQGTAPLLHLVPVGAEQLHNFFDTTRLLPPLRGPPATTLS